MRPRTPLRKFAPELESYLSSSTELYEACLDALPEVAQLILAHAMTLRQEEHLIPQIVPLNLYMECGASDPVVISLISLGLSRIAALLVKKHVRLGADATPESCRLVLMRKRLETLGLPSFCVRELKAIIG